MIRVGFFEASETLPSWAYLDKGVTVIQSDEQAGFIIRQTNGNVTSCKPSDLFETVEDANAAIAEFYRRELARVTEAYEKKIASLVGEPVVG